MIFTTISSEGVPNAAPIGLHRKDGRFFARIYNSKTLDNIIGYPVAAANMVDDPVIFVQSALSDIGSEKFEFIENFPVLRCSCGWIVFDCRCIKGEVISVVELMPVKGKINNRKIKPVNRGFNAVIEALIHATRYVISKEEKYLDLIKYHNTIVRRCGGPREQEAMRLLYKLLCLNNQHHNFNLLSRQT
ncbi:MAG: DUF447 family protein [Candidatus Methanoperedens sp.]|nr:DUF447 family protein [Candidatus Methanoperedens sp.]MCE8424690.1 DUF447 family protein [Candidatus Methanoperedens sp.]MCE8427128.1 DUF447 family protein [Candidatus Methanoperedens sp.]